MLVLRAAFFVLICLLCGIDDSSVRAWTHGSVTSFGLAANRTSVGVSTSSITANTTCRIEHFSHPDGALSSIQTVDLGWHLQQNQSPQNSGAYTIKRYIEYPANTFTQITWSSAASVTVSAGGLTKSDIIPISIPAGTKFWERTVNLNSTAASYPTISLPADAATIGVDDGCVASTDLGNSGTIAAGGTTGFIGAASIMGSVGVSNARSFAIVGDSIAFGVGDVSSSGRVGGSGYVARTLDAHGYPYTRLAVAAWTAQNLAANTTLPAAFYAAISFTDVIQELGVNDLQANSRTVAQVLADHQTIYGLFSGKNIFQTTITTETSSTDSWATTANQTFPPASPGTLSLLNSLNTSIRAVPANVHAILDAANAQMSATNSDIWATPPAPTTDGVHPNSGSAAAIATAIAGSL